MSARPTRRQKALLAEKGLDPRNYLVLAEQPNALVLRRRNTGQIVVVPHGSPRIPWGTPQKKPPSELEPPKTACENTH